MKHALLLVVVGCWSGAPAREPVAGPPKPRPVTPSEARELTISPGKPATLPDGATVDVKDIGYAHMINSENLSIATLVVERDGKQVELPLTRHHADNVGAPDWNGALGWQFRLEYVDAYGNPGSATVLMRRSHSSTSESK